MKREIKFRLYSEALRVMFSPETQIGHLWSIKEAPNGILKTAEGEILMQFTGLKDKNGKEIYEGDIIEITSYGDKKRRDVVEYDQFMNCGCCDDVKGIGFDFGTHNDFIVIGNIYENPELL